MHAMLQPCSSCYWLPTTGAGTISVYVQQNDRLADIVVHIAYECYYAMMEVTDISRATGTEGRKGHSKYNYR